MDGLLAAARAPRPPDATYFLAHPKPVSWSDLGAAAARIMGVPAARAARAGRRWPTPWALPRNSGRASRGNPGIVSREKIAEARCRCWICDPRRAAAELGFEAPTPLDAGLAGPLRGTRRPVG